MGSFETQRNARETPPRKTSHRSGSIKNELSQAGGKFPAGPILRPQAKKDLCTLCKCCLFARLTSSVCVCLLVQDRRQLKFWKQVQRENVLGIMKNASFQPEGSGFKPPPCQSSPVWSQVSDTCRICQMALIKFDLWSSLSTWESTEMLVQRNFPGCTQNFLYLVES